jgi:hypothetical protein
LGKGLVQRPWGEKELENSRKFSVGETAVLAREVSRGQTSLGQGFTHHERRGPGWHLNAREHRWETETQLGKGMAKVRPR